MQKVTKNKFMILNKTHAYLQTIRKSPVKFQKDRLKTVGEAAGKVHTPATFLQY